MLEQLQDEIWFPFLGKETEEQNDLRSTIKLVYLTFLSLGSRSFETWRSIFPLVWPISKGVGSWEAAFVSF